MAKIMDLDKVEGFFRGLYNNIDNSCDQNEKNRFASLRDDDERVAFMMNLRSFKDLKFTRVPSEKNDAEALQFKQDGNAAFLAKNWKLALECYNKCVLMTPTQNEDQFAIALANRSAALYHLEKFSLALSDIELAEKGYPKENMYKLKERAARCHLANKNLEQAMKAFQQTVHCLDESKLPIDKRFKLEKDAQIMIKMLPRELDMEKKMKKMLKKSKVAGPVEKLHKSVMFDYNELEGRYAKAAQDIKCGEEVLCEKAHCTALLQPFTRTHCQHCFTKASTMLPCPNCMDVVFCSVACRTAALSTYHRYECGILPIIWSSGTSVNCHMALRIIAQKSLRYFNDLKEELQSGTVTYESTKSLPSHDYRRALGLVCHEKERTCKSFFQYTLMASFLTGCLKAGGFFDDALNTEDSADLHFIASLILRNLQFIQFNSHEVFDLVVNKSNGKSRTVFIGGGLYPTLALFNHSCDPSIVRYFKGTTVYVNSIRNIKAGTSIGENYGPLYTQNHKMERQEDLRQYYWFDCNCMACMENWPTYSEMNNSEIRFKCDGGKADCNNVICIPADCNEFMIQCICCGEYTNILKGLKAVQDTEMIQKTAGRLLQDGSVDKALQKYIDMMNIIDDVMAPPFLDYCNCQQSIKDCLLEYGNRIEID